MHVYQGQKRISLQEQRVTAINLTTKMICIWMPIRCKKGNGQRFRCACIAEHHESSWSSYAQEEGPATVHVSSPTYIMSAPLMTYL